MAFGINVINANGIITITNEPCLYVSKGTLANNTRPSNITNKLAVRASNSSATIYKNLSGNFITSDGGTYDYIELIPISSSIPSSTYGFLIKNPYNTVVFDSNKTSPTISYRNIVDFSDLLDHTVNLDAQKTNSNYYIDEDSLQMVIFNKTLNSSTNVLLLTFKTLSNIAYLGKTSPIALYAGGEGNYTRGVKVPILIFQA